MRKLRINDPVRSSLKKRTVRQLQQAAADFGIALCPEFTKADLVDLLVDRMCGDLSDQAPEIPSEKS